MLISLALLAILLRLALPAFHDLVSQQRASAASNAITGAIALARSSAIIGHTPVTFCPNNAGACGSRNQWHLGGLIFADRNRNAQLDRNEWIYGTLPGFAPGVTVRWRSFRNRSYLRFLPSGLTAWQNGHFQYCPADADDRFSRALILNAQGRVRPALDRDGDGIREGADGEPLRCV